MNENTLYKKVGKKYVAVGEDFSFRNMCFHFRYGTYLVDIQKNSMSTAHVVDPNFVALEAAALSLRDELVDVISDAGKYQPPSEPLTPKQIKTWDAMTKAFNGNSSITAPSRNDIAHDLLMMLGNHSKKLMSNEPTKEAYEQFMLLSTLSKSSENK